MADDYIEYQVLNESIGLVKQLPDGPHLVLNGMSADLDAVFGEDKWRFEHNPFGGRSQFLSRKSGQPPWYGRPEGANIRLTEFGFDYLVERHGLDPEEDNSDQDEESAE